MVASEKNSKQFNFQIKYRKRIIIEERITGSTKQQTKILTGTLFFTKPDQDA